MTNDNANSESLPTPCAGVMTNDNANSESLPTPCAGAMMNHNAYSESLPTPCAGVMTNDNANSESLPTPCAGAMTNHNANSESLPTPCAGVNGNDNANSQNQVKLCTESIKNSSKISNNIVAGLLFESEDDYFSPEVYVKEKNRTKRGKPEKCLLCGCEVPKSVTYVCDLPLTSLNKLLSPFFLLKGFMLSKKCLLSPVGKN